MATGAPSAIYECETDGIVVRVRPSFLPDESDAAAGRFVWAYHVTIENAGAAAIRIIRRHWRIVDAGGRTQMVDGEGVIGQTPRIEPGESFNYTSGAPLGEPSGIMSGAYDVETDDGRLFAVAIPAFSLDSPYDTARPS